MKVKVEPNERTMKNYYKLATNGLVILGIFSFNLFASNISAQESVEDLDRPNVPLDDQVRFIGELEPRSSESSDLWNFAIGQGTLTENTYQLQQFQQNVQFIEQDKPLWDHTGEDPDYSILFTIYRM